MPETFLFPVGRLGNGRSVLISLGSSDVFLGVRLNTYTDSIERAGALCPCTGDLSRLSSRVIQRHAAVQKLSFSSPTRCPFKAMTAAAFVPSWNVRLQFFADVRLGRMRQMFVLFVRS
jgi:hypothetical protein